MKSTYKEIKVKIEKPDDVVTTSPDVESGRIPFSSYEVVQSSDGGEYSESSYNLKNPS